MLWWTEQVSASPLTIAPSLASSSPHHFDGAMRDIVHSLHEGVLYSHAGTRFHGTCLNVRVISFMPIKRYVFRVLHFDETGQPVSDKSRKMGELLLTVE